MERLRTLIRDVPDFPEPGIVFKDITPLLGDHGAFEASLDALTAPFRDRGIDKVVGIESRGFIMGAPVAARIGAGFVPVRKPGKLPYKTVSESYALEYGTDTLEVHEDSVAAGERVLIVDDVLATGGTAATTVTLMRRLGSEVVSVTVLVELAFLGGRARLDGVPFTSLVVYER